MFYLRIQRVSYQMPNAVSGIFPVVTFIIPNVSTKLSKIAFAAGPDKHS